MSKEVLLIVLGVWIALVPFMGFPGSWRTVIMIVVGLCIAVVGFFLRSEALSRGGGKGTHFFVDNRKSENTHEQRDEQTNRALVQ